MTELPKAAIALIELETEHGMEVLAMQRAFHDEDPWSGHWSFPGGKLEQGETALQAAIRETQEEVGIILHETQLVKDLGIGTAGIHQNTPTTVQSFVFRIKSSPVTKLDYTEARQISWISDSQFLEQSNHTLVRPFPHQEEKVFPCYPMIEGVLWGFSYGLLLRHWESKKTP